MRVRGLRKIFFEIFCIFRDGNPDPPRGTYIRHDDVNVI